jgi:hypothetical protein
MMYHIKKARLTTPMQRNTIGIKNRKLRLRQLGQLPQSLCENFLFGPPSIPYANPYILAMPIKVQLTPISNVGNKFTMSFIIKIPRF